MIDSENKLMSARRTGGIRRRELVSSDFLNTFLVLYPPANRMIRDCQYSTGQLHARLIPRDIEYSSAKPNYYTASQLVQAVSEMGYVLAGLSILDDDFAGLPKSSYQSYLERISSLECYYAKLELCFRRKLLKSEEQLATLTCHRGVSTSKKMMARMEARVGNSFLAQATLYVPLGNQSKNE